MHYTNDFSVASQEHGALWAVNRDIGKTELTAQSALSQVDLLYSLIHQKTKMAQLFV